MRLQLALLFSTIIDVKTFMSVYAPLNIISSGMLVPRRPRRISGSWPPRLLGLQKDLRFDSTKTLDKVESIPTPWISHYVQTSIVSPRDNRPLSRLSYILMCVQIPVECSTKFAKAGENKFPESPLLPAPPPTCRNACACGTGPAVYCTVSCSMSASRGAFSIGCGL